MKVRCYNNEERKYKIPNTQLLSGRNRDLFIMISVSKLKKNAKKRFWAVLAPGKNSYSEPEENSQP